MSDKTYALTERLGRLLTLVPHVLRRDGVPVQQLALDLGVSCAQVRADCALLNMVGRAPLTPDHLIDLHVEDDLVWVELAQNLTRPQRLSAAEAWALGVAVALVGPVAGVSAAIEGLWLRLVVQLPQAQGQALRRLRDRVVVDQDDAQTLDVAEVVQDAIARHEVLDVDYFSATSERQKTYRIGPLAQVVHGGAQYLVAQVEAGAPGAAPRLFKIARMGQVRRTQQTFEPQPVDLERYRTPGLFAYAQGLRGDVAVPPDKVADLHLPVDAQAVRLEADGVLHCEVAAPHPLALCRWAPRLSPYAQVCGPQSARATMRNLCDEAAAVYGRPSEKETTPWPVDPAITP